jgi:transposase InsO family protein
VVSLHGGLPGAWPQGLVTAKTTVAALLEHWRQFGLPAYAQFDNDTIFQGTHSARDSLSRVVRICLQLGVTAVFAPPRESGFQAAIENFNGRWQANYSAILGSLASGAISNAYYPGQDRHDLALTFENTLIAVASTAATNVLQEFVIRRLTPRAPNYAPAKP